MEVKNGTMVVADFVLIQGFILTLYRPLGFLGTFYRVIKQNLIDVENMFAILNESIDVEDVRLGGSCFFFSYLLLRSKKYLSSGIFDALELIFLFEISSFLILSVE